MCGICGIVHFDGQPADAQMLAAMTRTLEHRGPDDQGAWVGGSVGLAMRRLSIIDLSSGHQPIWNETGDVCVVFNGEIYNHPELRNHLAKGGHRLATRSDTEVLVHLYEDYGDGLVDHLDGMFAFAIWDARRRRLLLGRDRLGEKPLFYYKDGKRLVFGSELKALLAAGIPRTIDTPALFHYFALMSIPAPLTIFSGVQKLLPGHLLACDFEGHSALSCYWDVTDWEPEPGRSEAERATELAERLEHSVRQRLLSDVPVGALLSGGIDSSLVVATMARLSTDRVRTFSVAFGHDRQSDELPFARLVAERFNTVHHEVVVEPRVEEILPRLVWHFDEPFAVSSAVPLYFVSKVAREQVKVVLTGDGGDELFAGYPRYRWDRWADAAGVTGKALGKPVETALTALGSLSRRTPALRRLARFAHSLGLAPDARYSHYLSKFDGREREDLFTDAMLAQFRGMGLSDTVVLDTAYRRFPGGDPLNRRLYGDIKTSLSDEMLTKVDRMSMAAGLEARPPLLDHHLVELAATLPASDKLRGSEGKYLLKQVAAAVLPRGVVYRRKHGFDVPVGDWLRGELRRFAEDVMFSTRADTRGIWRPDAVRALWRRHQSGESGLGDRLWILLTWELWCRVVCEGVSAG